MQDTEVMRLLSETCVGGRIQSVSGAGIPSGPRAKYPGEHLFVNCAYDPNVAQLTPAQALATVRTDVIRLLQALPHPAALDGFRSIVVTLYYWKPPGGDPQPEPVGQCRLYVYAILLEGLPTDRGTIDEQYLLNNPWAQESSELDRLMALISQNSRHDPSFWIQGP